MAEEKKPKELSNDELLTEARERLNLAMDADEENRTKQLKVLKFLNGEQWHKADLKRRGDKRPSLVIDRLSGHIDVVAGEQRMNKPSIKVHPVDSEADPETADVMGGLIRNIEFTSFASRVRTNGYESTLQCGKGAWRVLIQFVDNETFNQEIVIKEIDNIFSVHIDPYCKGYMENANWGLVTDRITKEEYKRKYPDKAEPVSVQEAKGDLSNWFDEKTLKIAEYFKKVEKGRKTLYKKTDDTDTFEKPPDNEIAKNSDGTPIKREVIEWKILWYKISGNDILEGPVEWKGKYIPIIIVWGKKINIGDKTVLRGLVDKAIDAQRMYNYARSTMAETTALQPKTPYMLSEEMIKGHDGEWKTVDDEPKPYMVYKSDPNMPGKEPKRITPPVRSSGLEAEVQFCADEIKDTTTLQDASIGKDSQERSGIAIERRQRIGGITTYAFVDNLVSAITYEGKVIIDLIPKIYNKKRIIRTLGLDETENQVTINSDVDLITNKPLEKVHKFDIGKYDLTVTAGPSFATQRQEAREFLLQYMKEDPESIPLIRHVIMKYQDVPGADEITDIFKKVAPPGVIEDEGKEGEDGEIPEGIPGEMSEEEGMQQGDQEEVIEAIKKEAVENAVSSVEVQQEEAKLEGIRLENKKTWLEGLKLITDVNELIAELKNKKGNNQLSESFTANE